MFSLEDELEALRLKSDKYPCAFRLFLQRHGWVCDTKCPIREKAIDFINQQLADKEQNKYEKEYPDES